MALYTPLGLRNHISLVDVVDVVFQHLRKKSVPAMGYFFRHSCSTEANAQIPWGRSLLPTADQFAEMRSSGIETVLAPAFVLIWNVP